MKKIISLSPKSTEVSDLAVIINSEKPFSIIQVFDVDEFE